MIELVAIQFRGVDPGRAVPLRKSETAGAFALPEWQANPATNAPVAFVRRPSGSAANRVRVTFRRAAGTSGPIAGEVRAVDVTGANRMGRIAETQVQLSGATAQASIDLTLAGANLNEVFRHDDQWRWEFRQAGQTSFQPIRTTSHRVFIVLAEPFLPWTSAAGDERRWVWSDVLDFACEWASGATSVGAAADAIAIRLFDMGSLAIPPGLRYESFAGYKLQPNRFRCGSFLHRLAGAPATTSSRVNCEDCSMIVSTFANSLGCRLWQAQMEGSLSSTNVIQKIGGSPATQPLGMHEVAWGGDATLTDPVWDGCFQAVVAGVPRPLVSIPFHHPSQPDYRERLMSPLGVNNCQPTGQVLPGANRAVMKGAAVNAPQPAAVDGRREGRMWHDLVRKRLGDQVARNLVSARSPLAALFFHNFFWRPADLPGWRIVSAENLSDPPLRIEDSCWLQLEHDARQIRVYNYESVSREASLEIFAAELSDFAGQPVVLPELGEAAFRDEKWLFIAFIAGNVVMRVAVEGAEDASLEPLVRSFQAFLSGGGVASKARLKASRKIWSARFTLPGQDPSGRRVWQRLLPRTGSVSRTESELIYSAEQTEGRVIEVRTYRDVSGEPDYEDTLLPF